MATAGIESTSDYSSLQDIFDLLGLKRNLKHRAETESELKFRHRRFQTGEFIYHMGQAFSVLYIVRFGFLKTVLRNAQGDERVLSFPMKSDLLGFDGVYRNRCTSDTVALTEVELITIPVKQLFTPGHVNSELDRIIYVNASREIALERCGMGLSITVEAKARVARFLAMQAKRYANLGYSSRSFVLPMTRHDLGSYLGLSLETISRSLSALAAAGVIAVNRRDIQILKPEQLILPPNFPLLPKRAASYPAE
ncbi:helix-turn-helix domain-containing protein [Alcaligenaceae bacterium CGII-47]|nr:helix-turn-helix domain-containing protein [Alcaligenaceae bacterium CGII-47]